MLRSRDLFVVSYLRVVGNLLKKHPRRNSVHLSVSVCSRSFCGMSTLKEAFQIFEIEDQYIDNYQGRNHKFNRGKDV